MEKLQIEIDYAERETSQWKQKTQSKLIEMATTLFDNPHNFEFGYQNDNYNYKINITAFFCSDGPKRNR
jgi:hypothetical protein